MADTKKVEKTAESTGFQNVGAEAAAPPAAPDASAPKTLMEARIAKQTEDAAASEAQAKVREEVADRDKKAKPGEGKPSKQTEAEMARGGKK